MYSRDPWSDEGGRGCAHSVCVSCRQSLAKEGTGLNQEGFLEEGSFKPNLGKGGVRAKVSCVGR